MTIRTPPLNSLKVFEAAARHLSFKKAAEELHVTPAAVSHQLGQLEALLGVMLFRRVNQGIVLTPAARLCLPKLQEGLECLRESVEQIRVHARSDTITVASSPSFAMRWLMPRLHRFIIAHPDIDVQVSTRMGPFVGDRVTRNSSRGVHGWAAENDVILMFGNGLYEGLQVERLMPLSVTPLCHPRLLDGPCPLHTPEDLVHHDLLHDDRGALYANRSFWKLWLSAAGVSHPDAEGGTHFTHALMALGAAAEGLGVVASTPDLAQVELTAGTLVAPFALRIPLESSYHVVSSDLAYKRDDVAVFRAWLHAEAAQDQSLATDSAHANSAG
jgi:LysR family glycine cleavage system transcriptional activator